LAKNAGKRLGGSILINTKRGANAIIGAQLVAKARPNGDTTLVAAGFTMARCALVSQF
jgi:hypothetical protein